MTAERAGLTEKKKRFCHEYLIDYNGKQAAIRSGFSARSATQQASMMLAEDVVRVYLKEITQRVNTDLTVTAERVIREFARLAFHNVGDYYKKDAKGNEVLKPLAELTVDQRAAIIEYNPKEKTMKLAAKEGSLVHLGKHLRLFTELNELQTTFNILPELKLNGKTIIFNVGEPRKK